MAGGSMLRSQCLGSSQFILTSCGPVAPELMDDRTPYLGARCQSRRLDRQWRILPCAQVRAGGQGSCQNSVTAIFE
jgi:hypothetical protein